MKGVRSAALVWLLAASCGAPPVAREPRAVDASEGRPDPLRSAYFGDLHVHTRYSYDAFIFDTKASPDDAYRYAKGEPLVHAGGFEIRLTGEPLDFLAVTDHAEYLGAFASMGEEGGPLSNLTLAAEVRDADEEKERAFLWRAMGERHASGELAAVLAGWEQVGREAWRDTVAAAERHYAPGRFTTFAAYEFSSAPPSGNLHRNVIFRDRAPESPWSSLDSYNPEELWAWLDARRAEGIEGLAIPHNPNASNGRMFALETWAGAAPDAAWAAARMRNEPLVEVTQIKGTSETHPLLSPNDEWADFGVIGLRLGSLTQSAVEGSYVRGAYARGLELEASIGSNPFKFGLIGSSDTHNAAGSFDESSYFSTMGRLDDTAPERGSVPRRSDVGGEAAFAETYHALWSASGLAAVWAEENTRASIFAALRRKETFATSGPRIRVRFFAGYDFGDDLARDPDAVAKAYAGGVPMGADLAARGGDAPGFLVWAMRDPRSAPLERLQVIKMWVEQGKARESVFDAACSDRLEPDPTAWRCPPNGATVDLADCSLSLDRGAAEIGVLWRDPWFVAGERAAYYVRVIENPTCRWSTWDALRAGTAPNPALPATIQERAWSSPIWYVPSP